MSAMSRKQKFGGKLPEAQNVASGVDKRWHAAYRSTDDILAEVLNEEGFCDVWSEEH
jgi:hypothetical protein